MFDPREIDWDRPSYIMLGKGFITLISVEDEDLRCDQWQLHRDQRGRAYARRQICAFNNRIGLYLHRAVMLRISPPPGPKYVPHHINGNGLDNRRDNLRWATISENNKHKSDWTRFKEIDWQRREQERLGLIFNPYDFS
jgi:hypothetical protein